MIVVSAALMIAGYLALGALLQLLVRDLATGLGLTGSWFRLLSVTWASDFRPSP